LAPVVLLTLLLLGSPPPALAQSGTTVYVALTDANVVAAIDEASNSVVANIAIAASGASGTGTRPFALAASPDGQWVYVVNESCGLATPPSSSAGGTPSVQGTVSVIATASQSVVATALVGYCPNSIAVSADGARAYVTGQSTANTTGAVTVLDISAPASPAVLTTLPVPNDEGKVESLALTPDGQQLYVSTQGGIDVVDASTGALERTVQLVYSIPPNTFGAQPVLDAISPNGAQVYASTNAGNFNVIDTATNNVVFSSPGLAFCSPGPLAFAPDGTRAFLVDVECRVVGVIDTASHGVTFVGTPPLGFGPLYPAVSPDGLHLYVGARAPQNIPDAGSDGGSADAGADSGVNAGEMVVIDASSLSLASAVAIPLGGPPAGIAFSVAAAVGNTPASASPVTASLIDPTAGLPVTVTFASVSTAGNTTVAASGNCTPVTGYVFANPTICFDLATTASVAGPITVCVDDVTVPSPFVPTLVHYVGGLPTAVPTTVGTGTVAGTSKVCGSVSSLSPFGVLGHDVTPPVLQLPADMATDATGPGGAIVVFAVTATDDLDPAPAVSCSPPSGSLFPVNPPAASTQVTCTAADAARNVSVPGFFAVHVRGAQEQLGELSALLESLQLDKRVELGLEKLVRYVGEELAEGESWETCLGLDAFVWLVKELSGPGAEGWQSRAPALTADEAVQLVGAATRIESVLACPSFP
jgi:DNA-binding beta-propeller fold protein YncE